MAEVGEVVGEGMGSAGLVRVLVVDDQELIREGIASLLGIQDGIAVVGTARDGREAVERAVELAPDVVLMDVRMPLMDGVQAVVEMVRRGLGCRVVMLTTFDDEEYVVNALRAGAAGYLLKDLPSKDLAAAVRLAHSGVATLHPTAASRLAAAVPVSGDEGRTTVSIVDGGGSPLTGREMAVLRLVAEGMTNREIAQRLHLSEGTVKNYLSRILERLGMRDRTQAAIYARDNGLL